MVLLKEGDWAPTFKGKDQNGKHISLRDYKGKKLILYFYPKDNTSGCTAEACNLRNHYENLGKLGFEVVGVSPDSEKSHLAFAGKHALPFTLIADTDKEILQAYGAWGEKKNYGRTYMGVIRVTYVIDEKGIIEKVFNKVQTKAHTEQILSSYAWEGDRNAKR